MTSPSHILQQGDNDFVAFQGAGFRLGTDPSILRRGQSGIFDEDVQALDDEVPCGQPEIRDDDDGPVFSAPRPGRHRDQGDPGSEDMNSFLMSQPNPYMSQPNPYTIAQNLKEETLDTWLFLASA